MFGTMGYLVGEIYIEFPNNKFKYEAPNHKKITKEDLKKVFEIIKPAIEDYILHEKIKAENILEGMAQAKENLETFSKKMKK